MKKLCFLFVMLFMLTGCSKINEVPNEEKFLQDYTSKNTEITYDSCKTYNKVLLKKENRFIADVDFFKKDEYANYETRMKFTYKFFENSGWVLEDFIITNEAVNCFKGRTLKEIEKDISENYKTYISGATKATVEEVSDVTSGTSQKVKVECERLNGNVTSKYKNAIIEFKYISGKWQFNSTTFGEAENYYINLEGSKWQYVNYSNPTKPKEYQDIEITHVSENGKTINFIYGGKDYTATLSDDYNSFENKHVKYTVSENFYIGKERNVKNPKDLYVKEIKLPTFIRIKDDNDWLDNYIVLTAYCEYYSKWNYIPTETIYYELK